MAGRYRFALRPGWVVFHLVCVALCVTMILLGRWQLIVSNEKHFSLQNFGYALQWWAFTAFVLWMWAKLLRDNANDGGRIRAGDSAPDGATEPAAGEVQATPVPAAASGRPQGAYRRYVMPSVRRDAQEDPELAAYNDYLANLADPGGAADKDGHAH